MKLSSKQSNRRRTESGFFLTIVLLIIASIMLIYVAANARRLALLKKEIQLVEQKQIQHLKLSNNITTNVPPEAALPAVTK